MKRCERDADDCDVKRYLKNKAKIEAESEEYDMTKEQKDKIFKVMAEDRNEYVRGCDRRIAKEDGKIEGADYMLQRFIDILRIEGEPQESEVSDEDCD